MNYAVPPDCTVGEILDDLSRCLPRGGGSNCGADSGGDGLDLRGEHLLCVVLLDLATDPRASSAAVLALPNGHTLASLGIGSGAVLTLVPQASLLEASTPYKAPNK